MGDAISKSMPLQLCWHDLVPSAAPGWSMPRIDRIFVKIHCQTLKSLHWAGANCDFQKFIPLNFHRDNTWDIPNTKVIRSRSNFKSLIQSKEKLEHLTKMVERFIIILLLFFNMDKATYFPQRSFGKPLNHFSWNLKKYLLETYTWHGKFQPT